MNEKKLAPISVMVAISALRFVYGFSLKKVWSYWRSCVTGGEWKGLGTGSFQATSPIGISRRIPLLWPVDRSIVFAKSLSRSPRIHCVTIPRPRLLPGKFVLALFSETSTLNRHSLALSINNAAERSLRTVVLGRKKYLFCGSDTGGERAAAIYGLIGTAKLNGLNPEAYLREVLLRYR